MGVVALQGPGILEGELSGARVWTKCLGMQGIPWMQNIPWMPRMPQMACHLRGRPVRRLAGLLEDSGCEVLHTHLARSDLVGLSAARRAGVPVTVCTRHNVHEPWQGVLPAAIAYGKALSRADGLIVVSVAARRHVQEVFRVAPGNCRVIPGGVDAEKFRPGPADEELRARWGLGPECFVVAAGGRLSREKGVHLALRAAAVAMAKVPAVRLLVLGDGRERKRLQGLAMRLGISDRVVFAGWQLDMPRALSIADVAMQLSLTEGLGLAIIEAMAMGKCVLAARVGGIPEIIDHGKTGLLVGRGAARDAGDILSDLARSRKRCGELGAAARSRAVESFQLNTIAASICRYYGELLEKKKGRPG